MTIDHTIGIFGLLFAAILAVIGPLISPTEVGKIFFFVLLFAACGIIGVIGRGKGAGG